MQDVEGNIVDTYVPRKCEATNRIIPAKDHASAQINIGHLNAEGVFTASFSTVALSGFVRRAGDSDAAMVKFAQNNGLVKKIFDITPN